MSDALEDFRRTIEEASERLRLIPEALSRAPLSDGKWSAKEIIGHLIDSASNNHQRFVRAQFTDALVFPPYDQEAWVRAQRYNEEPWPLLVQLWESYNLHLLHVMSSIPAETRTRLRPTHNLQRIGWKTVSENEPVTLEYFMLDYIAHLKNHLKQIFAKG
ncbi:MAG TPA: DinB family protein [Pyrinomonadaceae bacterium]|jgi:hypothetical protein|nr:DinB family protein [Pyrinomonadaceae bacterium]